MKAMAPSAVRDGFGPVRGFTGRDERYERLLVVLMASRLALSVGSLGIGLLLEAVGGSVTITEWQGFYGAVSAAFVLTVVYRLFAGRIKRPRLFAAVNIATDVALVSALVLFSGGRDSVFTFLYVVVAAYAALLFRRFGALAWGGVASAAYGIVLLAAQRGWVTAATGPESASIVLMTWTVHAAAIVLVSALASFLADELERTGEALRRRTTALVELQTLHQRTVDSLMSGLLTTDPEGRITSFNPEAERITGLPVDRAFGREIDEVLPGIREVLAPSEETHRERTRARLSFRTPGGDERYLGVGAYTLRDADGQASGRVVIFQDVTDVVRMEQELRRSERLAAVGQLSASIAHEVRNPLASISGSIQMMRERAAGLGGEDGPEARLMDIVIREVDRLNHLIGDFLHFARPGPLHVAPVLVCRVVDEVIEMFEAVRPARLEVRREVDPGLMASADAEQLRQVLWNLVLNASQAMPEGGQLCLAATRLSGESTQGEHSGGRMGGEEKALWAEIAVMDQGIGIPEDALEHVFDPFFTTKKEGSGLGLATVHRIVEDHGGTIRVERGEGDWSTVIRVRLPGAEGSP